MARPSDYTPETAAKICEMIADGASLRSICRNIDMPGLSTVFQWLAAHPTFAEQYAHARDVQADTLADELLEIADDATNDWMERFGKDGQSLGYFPDQDHINRSRLRVDTRKWIASKLKPKKYGERTETHLTGSISLTQLIERVASGG